MAHPRRIAASHGWSRRSRGEGLASDHASADLTIDEFLSRREAVAGEGVRVAGRVAADSMQWNASTLDLRFRLANFAGSGGVDVTYNGVLPDMFAEGRDVIVEGTYAHDGVFRARTLMTSCPSKYEAEVPKT